MPRTGITGPYRKDINNLISNGDFEYAPRFTANTTSSARFIDGTAAGTSIVNIYGWYTSYVNSCSAQFDSIEKASGNNSLRVSTTGVNAVAQIISVELQNTRSSSYFEILPSTSYTITFKMKTNYVSGDGRGAFLRHSQYTKDKIVGTGNDSTYIKTTTNWRSYTLTFTTGATARFGQIKLFTFGQDSPATLVMDAWFDDIVMTRTTLLPRTAVTTPRRTIKDNRYSVRWPTLGSGSSTTTTVSADIAELGVTNLNYSAGIWFKESSKRLTFGNIIFRLVKAAPTRYAFQFYSFNNNKIAVAFWDGTSNPDVASSKSYPIGEWYHVAFTRQGTSVKLYVNGVLSITGTITINTTASDSIGIGTSTAFAGNVSKAFIYGKVLTAAEISNIYSDDVYPDDALFNAPLNEGKGTIAYDTVNNNNITLTTPTWSTDTVTGIRRQDKLLQNGDFEFAPAFTAPTTGSSRWIDGTANGSTNISQYGWGMIKTGTASAQFDTTVKQSGTTSLKLSTASVSSYIEADVYNTLATGEPKSYLIPALQSTSYTLSFYMKTEYISGDSSQGATVGLAELNGVLTVIRDNTGTGAVLKTTTGWTYYSFSVTTLSTTRFINVQPRIFGHTGAATLQMNAWFDDITLVKN